MYNKFTVSLFFFDGYTTTRDLRDIGELEHYMSQGFDWKLVRNVQVIHHPHAES